MVRRLSRKKIKTAIQLLVAGALFFLALSRAGITDRIQIEAWLLIAIAIWLTITALEGNNTRR